MVDERSLYDVVMGRPAPSSDAPSVEIVNASGQFAAALLMRIATKVLGNDQMAISAAITEAVKIDRGRRDRVVLRAELRIFLAATVQTRDVAIPVWLNLIGFSNGGAQRALEYAGRFSLDAIDTGRAVLVGLDTERLETLCHIAGMTGVDVYRLVCNAVQIESDAGRLDITRGDHV
jgi:hypothetical protein